MATDIVLKSTEALRLWDVRYHFRGVTAVDGVSLTINDGESVALVGPNGAGKTTLLNLINGFLYPTDGRIEFERVSMKKVDVHRRARMGMRRTFQRPHNFASLSAIDNLLIGNLQGRMSWWQTLLRSRRELYPLIRPQLSSMHSERIEGCFPHELSHGDRRRLEVLCCLASKPKLLLLDEPGAGLNRDEKQELAEVLKAARSAFPVTILVVDHDVGFLEMVCERSILMISGRIEGDALMTSSAASVSSLDEYARRGR